MLVEGTTTDIESVNPVMNLGYDNLKSVDSALKRIFPSKLEETRVEIARRIMSSAVVSLPNEDLEVYITEFQYLIDSWFDQFEKQAYDGLTLKQLLGQG